MNDGVVILLRDSEEVLYANRKAQKSNVKVNESFCMLTHRKAESFRVNTKCFAPFDVNKIAEGDHAIEHVSTDHLESLSDLMESQLEWGNISQYRMFRVVTPRASPDDSAMKLLDIPNGTGERESHGNSRVSFVKIKTKHIHYLG